MSVGHRDGEPSWADLTSPDPGTSRAFLGELLGWTFEDTGPEYGHYLVCRRDGVAVAGIAGTTPADGSTPPAWPRWRLYLAASDLAAVADRVAGTGGRVLAGPTELPIVGTVLHAVDPLGIAVGFRRRPGEAPGGWGEAGALCWAEVYTRDGAATDAFYRELFAYEQVQQGDGANFDYTAWRLDGRAVCGRMAVTNDLTAAGPPQWIVYVAVSDVDAVAAAVPGLGGAVPREPTVTPYGRWAMVTDPHGAELAVVTRLDSVGR
jgi:predicted enzyme related to lactoylglutathione lyase